MLGTSEAKSGISCVGAHISQGPLSHISEETFFEVVLHTDTFVLYVKGKTINLMVSCDFFLI